MSRMRSAGPVQCVRQPLRMLCLAAAAALLVACAAARQVVICILGSLKAEIGDLSRVTRVVRVFGMVNSAPDFTAQSQVMNAASGLLNEVFGDRGRHVRSAVGMASLPVNLTVEIEMVFEVEEG